MIKGKQFCSVLEMFDLFGVSINLRYDNSTLHKTKIGGFVSIIIYLALILQSIVIIQNLTDQTRPNTLQELIYVDSPEKTFLNHSNFPFAFGLINTKAEGFMDERIYKVTLWHKVTNKIFDTTNNKYQSVQNHRVITTEPCTPNHFQMSDIKDYFLLQSYTQMYCIALNETNVYIQGGLDSLIYSRLDLIVEQCSGSSCKSPQEMQTQLSNGKLVVYFQNNIYQPTNKAKPFQPFGRMQFYTSGPEFTKGLNLYFRSSFLYSDIGLLGESIQEEQILQYAYDREQVVPKSGNMLYDLFIAHDLHYQNKYVRQYPKFDKALSQFGGIFNLLFLIGALFCKPLSQIELNRKILNSVYDFNVNDNTANIKKKDFEKQLQEKYKDGEMNNQNQSGFKLLNASVVNSKDIYKSISTKLNAFYGRQSKYDKNKDQENLTIECMIPTNLEEDSNKTPHNFRINFEHSPLRLQQSRNFKLLSINRDSKLEQSSNNKQTDLFQDKVITEGEDTESQKTVIMNSSQIPDQKNLGQIEQGSQPNRETFFINPFDFIRNYFIKPRNGTDQLISKGSINCIIKKLHELDKLKRLLLNEEQIRQFENLPKPILYSTGQISIINY